MVFEVLSCHTKQTPRHYAIRTLPLPFKGFKPIPVVARSKAWVCGRSIAGIAVSIPAGGMDSCLECYVLSGRDLCDGADPSSRGVLTSVCVCVCH